MSPVAIVSGEADDVCAAGAMRLAGDGMDVAVLRREPGAGTEMAKRVAETGRRSVAIETDITDAVSVEAALADVRATLGDPSVLLYGVSLTACCPLDRLSDNDWQVMTSDPLRGVFLTSRAVLDPMLQNGAGHIITIADVTHQEPGRSHENLTLRAALGGFTMTIAMELRSFGITANLIVPASGTVGISLVADVDGTGGAGMGAYPTHAVQAAAALPFLIGDMASAMSGQIICLGE